MEADIDNPSHVNRFHIDGVHNTNIVEWSKKRKPQSDQLDLHRPKHKCWVGHTSAEQARMFGENPLLGSMNIRLGKGRTDATSLEDCSEPESAKDSNSFIEDSNTAMCVNEEGKVEADSAKTYLYGRPSNFYVDWDGVEKVSSSEEDKYVDNEHNPSYQYTDFHALKNIEEHFLGLASHADHMYLEYAKESFEESVDKEIEDILYSKGENPNMCVFSSGRWNVNDEAQSSTRPPTIDEEFEQYFSMLML